MEATEVRPEEVLGQVREFLASRDTTALARLLDRLPSSGLGHVFRELTPAEIAALLSLLGDEEVAELVGRLDASEAAQLLLRLARPQAADILEEMDPDDAADVVEEFRPSEADAILDEMTHPEAAEIRELLGYPPETAGGRMTPEYVSVSPDLTVDEALAAIRELAAEAETIYYVYVTDAEERLLGVLSLRDLVLAKPGTHVRDVMVGDPVSVRADEDQEVAARLVLDRGLLAVPVVDAAGRMVGIITADDVADVVEEEVTEDIARIGGQVPLEEPYLLASPLDVVRKRVVWLLVLFVAQAYTGSVLQHFESELSALVVLAFFIPMLIGTGGNVGSQTVTMVVRAMALGEVGIGDLLRVLAKELTVGVLLGVLMGVTTIVRAWTMGVSADVGLVVGLSALFVVIWAATVAALLPLLIHRLGFDPAVVSAPLITTLVDGTGLFMYFTLARLLLSL